MFNTLESLVENSGHLGKVMAAKTAELSSATFITGLIYFSVL